MISLVDASEVANVLRPTVYRPSAAVRSEGSRPAPLHDVDVPRAVLAADRVAIAAAPSFDALPR
jgi:hypothetical protein